MTNSTAGSESNSSAQFWRTNYEARQKYFERTVGPLPTDILKMFDMIGVWPGGGLYAIPAPKLGKDISLYTTFGLTNSDMPTTVQLAAFELESDGKRATGANGSLQKKQPALIKPGAAGYGYEIVMIARSKQQWPLNFLQWAVSAEIELDIDFLSRVEKNDGLTVEQIDVGKGQEIDVLIAKAQPPLPIGTALPAGKMDVLVATVITPQEMEWSQQHGRGALLKILQEAGVGQISDLDRQSVVP